MEKPAKKLLYKGHAIDPSIRLLVQLLNMIIKWVWNELDVGFSQLTSSSFSPNLTTNHSP